MSDSVAEFNAELERLDKALAALDAQIDRLYEAYDDDLAGGMHRRDALPSLSVAASAAADEVDGLAAAVGTLAGKLARLSRGDGE